MLPEGVDVDEMTLHSTLSRYFRPNHFVAILGSRAFQLLSAKIWNVLPAVVWLAATGQGFR